MPGRKSRTSGRQGGDAQHRSRDDVNQAGLASWVKMKLREIPARTTAIDRVNRLR
jgi:hypothetical protein